MKTILYQPLFINPQAYFVFPQLYHIEKGDSYIEPANITGQLIINDLTKVLTSTPTLNVVQDTNQVDFGLFKGKHIRISQYTNIGAVVLGEWYIPGTPEPEQPDWFKESIVAWYSPYCKQKLTNYDVIESYAEDFTSNNWKHTNNVTVTNNSFHLTYGNLTYELYPSTTYNTKSMTVIVKGLNGIKGFIRYRYGQKDYVYINKDGIYYLPAKIDDIKVLGFQTHFKSECDITITQLPTSILKDFSGNGNHAYLYGGKGKLNSGMGLYKVDFTSWRKSSVQTEVKPDVVKVTPNTLVKEKMRVAHGNILLFNRTLTEYELSWVKNNMMCSKPQEPDKDDILKSLVVHYNIGKQGSNSIKSTNTLTDYSGNNRHATCKNFNWVNTQFVDDGKAMRFDDNGSCIVGINMPQLDKYTVIAKRRWIDKKSENKWFCSLGNGDYTSASQSLFWFEGGLLNNVFYTYNKGYKNPIVLPELISIQSSDDYNGVRINSSNGVQADNKLFIGSVGENDNTHVVADFYQLLLFDRVLTDEEREWVKENLIEPDTVSAAKACTALFEPENLEITDEYHTGIIRDSLGGDYYMVAHSDDYTIENGLMKSTDDTFLVSIENANENDVKAMIIDMYYDSTVPGSYLNGEYTEGSVKLTNRRIMGINNPTTTSVFQDLMQVLETGFTIGKVALYNKELTKDEFDSEAFHKGFAVRHSTFEKNASTHLFRDGHKELTPGEYLLPFETLYLRVDVPEGYTMQDYVFDEIEQSWKPNTPKSYICPEHDFHIIAMGEQMKVIKNWSPLASISTFGFRATDNQIEFAGSTDGDTMTYILDDTDVTKFTIQYTNTAGKGNVYLIIGDRQYDVISGQPQTYSVSGAVKLDFLNMEEVANFAGTIKFTNVV